MSATLVRVDADEPMLTHPKVLAMTFGPDPWDKYIGDWLFGRTGDPVDSAAGCLACGGRVWFHIETAPGPLQGRVVGVSSFGEASIRDWPIKKARTPTSTSPALGVDLNCRGNGYGKLIVESVLDEAKKVAHLRPAIVFYVDTENPCLEWYKRVFNFAEHGKPYNDPTSGRPHARLVLAVNQPPVPPA